MAVGEVDLVPSLVAVVEIDREAHLPAPVEIRAESLGTFPARGPAFRYLICR